MRSNVGLLAAVLADRVFAQGQADLRTLEAIPPERFVPQPPDDAVAAASGAAETPMGPRANNGTRQGEPEEYDIYSGSTHGRLASFLETRKMAGDDVGSAVLFMNLISVVAPAYVVAVQSLHEFVAGASIPADVLEGVADSLGLKSDALAPPDVS